MRYLHAPLALVRRCRDVLLGLAGIASFIMVLTWIATGVNAQKVTNEGSVDAFVPLQATCLIHVRFSEVWNSDLGKVWRQAGLSGTHPISNGPSNPAWNLEQNVKHALMVEPDDIESMLIAQMHPPLANELLTMNRIARPWSATPFQDKNQFSTGTKFMGTGMTYKSTGKADETSAPHKPPPPPPPPKNARRAAAALNAQQTVTRAIGDNKTALGGQDDASIARAKKDIKNIEKAIVIYKVKHFTYPPDLETLTNPDEDEVALLKDEDLYDPWKQHYFYNPGDLHPKTKIPRIYSNGHPDAPHMISNWDLGMVAEDVRTTLANNSLLIVTVKQAKDLKQAQELASKNGRRVVHKGMAYYTAGSQDDAVLFINGQTMVRGPETLIRDGIEAQAKGAKLHPRLATLRKNADKHIWIDWQRDTNTDQAARGKESEEEYYRMFLQLKALLALKSKQVSYQLGKEIVVASHSEFGTPAEAQKAVPALRDWLQLRRFIEPGMLYGAIQETMKREGDPVRDEALTTCALFFERLDAAMREPVIHQDGTAVDVTVRFQPDLAALQAAAKETVKKSWADPDKMARKLLPQSRANLQSILMALQSYENINKELPPPILFNKAGEPLLSWRVAILPFLGENELYNQFHLNEAWDSPHNIKLVAKMPKAYAVPGATSKEPGRTYYQAIAGLSTGWEVLVDADAPKGARGLKIKEDALAQTVAVIEAADSVVWTKPEDLEYSKATKVLPKIGGHFKDKVNMATFSQVLTVRLPVSDADLRAIITRKNGNAMSPDFWQHVEKFDDQIKPR
jgi:hypothetical protein